jgi:hypothetical protein
MPCNNNNTHQKGSKTPNTINKLEGPGKKLKKLRDVVE